MEWKFEWRHSNGYYIMDVVGVPSAGKVSHCWNLIWNWHLLKTCSDNLFFFLQNMNFSVFTTWWLRRCCSGAPGQNYWGQYNPTRQYCFFNSAVSVVVKWRSSTEVCRFGGKSSWFFILSFNGEIICEELSQSAPSEGCWIWAGGS